MIDTVPRKSNQTFRVRLGLIILLVGFLAYGMGTNPLSFGVDRSPVTGFVQLAVLLAGLALICISGYVTLNVLWNGRQKTILADIGIRLVATGYVIAFFSGLADIFGLGSHPFPNIPSFGYIQVAGLLAGEAIIVLGFLLFVPNPRKEKETA
jgi:hypothetical protein